MKKLFVSVFSLVLTVLLVVGCGASKNTHKVTFYDSDGKTVIKTLEVEEGKKAEHFVPEKYGHSFVNWFGTPSLEHKFDFNKEITEDTSVFAGFVQYTEDTREFAIVGSGKSPVLISSNWGKVIKDEHKMTKSKDAEVNIYTITLDLVEGDEFQFAINTSWNNQRGFGYLETIEADGKEYFVNSGSLGDTSSKRSNIKVAVSGNYTFTLTTYPSADVYEEDNASYTEENKEAFNTNPFDTITWTYNGEGSGESAAETTYYIKGAEITGWADKYTEKTAFVNENGKHTLVIPLKKGDEFMFTSLVKVGDSSSAGTEYIRHSNIKADDSKSLGFVEGTDRKNLIAKENGTYTFTYDPETTVLTVNCDTSKFIEEHDYYLKGSFGGTNWETELKEEYQLKETEKGSGIYVLDSVTLAAGDELGVQSMILNAAKDGLAVDKARVLFMEYSYLAPAGEGNSNGDFAGKNGDSGNIVASKGGSYKVTFNAYTSEIIFEGK